MGRTVVSTFYPTASVKINPSLEAQKLLPVSPSSTSNVKTVISVKALVEFFGEYF
jgi:hypothetical protein